MNYSAIGVVVVSLAVVSACASLEGSHLSDSKTPADGIAVSATGLPYTLTRPTFAITRSTTREGKAAKPVHQIVVGYEPDPERRFEVGMKPGWFSSDVFDLKWNTGGTLSSLNSSTSDQSAAILAGLTDLGIYTAEAVIRGMSLASADGIFVQACEAGLIDAAIADRMRTHLSLALALRRGDPGKLVKKRAFAAASPDYMEKSKLIARALKGGTEGFPLTPSTDCGGPLPADEVAAPGDRGDGGEHEVEDIIRGATEDPSGDEPIEALPAEGGGTHFYPDGIRGRVRALERGDDAFDEVNRAYQLLQQLEAADRAVAQALALSKPAEATLAGVIKKLTKAAQGAAAACAKDLETKDRCSRRQRSTLESSLARVRSAIQIAIDAEDALSGGRLTARRDSLATHLAQAIPSNVTNKGSLAYKNLAAELAAVQLAIGKALPKAPDSPKALPDANQVTSRVSDDIAIDRLSTTISQGELRARILVAEALVRFGSANAVIITYPLSGGI